MVAILFRNHLEKQHVRNLRLKPLRQASFDIKKITYRMKSKMKYQVSSSTKLWKPVESMK